MGIRGQGLGLKSANRPRRAPDPSIDPLPVPDPDPRVSSTLQQWLGVPVDAAERILGRLASSGLVREVHKGVWTRGTWPGTQREWY